MLCLCFVNFDLGCVLAMQYPGTRLALNAKSTATALGLVLISITLLLHQYLPDTFSIASTQILEESATSELHNPEEPVRTPDPKNSEVTKLGHTGDTYRNIAPIPNAVHFIHLIKPTESPAFEFPFRQFIAIYSAWHYLQPEVIYIHTNIEEHLIGKALRNATNPYTKAVSRLPCIKFNHQRAPNHTTSGISIDKLPNQSDFVRTEVLRKFGGIYLDDDGYVLRDLKPLRYLAYENIVGRQANDQICPAVILATPENKLMTAYHALQDRVFDSSSWARHATDLLTSLVLEFQIPDHQVLILPQDTFFPLQWGQPELQVIYQVHTNDDNDGLPFGNSEANSQMNVTDFIENFTMDRPSTWKRDWRTSYVLHGWTSGIEMNMDEGARNTLFGDFGGITPAYVMARNSNFARAVYPAVKHAIDHDVLQDIKYDQS